MQEIHPISTATARLLGDRRLRPHGHHPNNQQSLKCPRCESLNTKFCYYNNYNLSQPRHFCKNCRRYWTKGGVLRNVPVGGGCRKSKRSSKPKAAKSSVGKRVHSQSSTESSSHNNKSDNNSNSNSNNCGDGCNNTITTASASGATGMSSSGCGGLFQISDGENFSIRNLNPLGENAVHQVGELAGFMNLMGNNNSDHQQHNQNNQLSFCGCADDNTATASFSQFLQSQSTAAIGGVQDWGFGKMGGVHHGVEEEKMGGILDPTVRIDDLLQNRGSSGALATLDWNQTAENGHQGFFDLPSTVDHHAAFWTHSTPTVELDHDSHWSDNANDHSLFLP